MYTSKLQSQKESLITKTCPDLTMNNSKQRLQMGGLEPQHLHEIGNLIKRLIHQEHIMI